MTYRGRSYQAWLLGGAAAVAMMQGGVAAAQDTRFDIAPQPLASALNEFSLQSRQSVLFTTDLAQSKTSPGVSGEVEVADALSSILAGTGLTWKRQGDTFLVMRAAADPQSGSAAGDGAEVDTLVVTAQKREEDIQDVPIAISAFTQESLERSQIAGGPDLMTQIPNMTFTKTNFASYSIQIRGIGTQAISATTDAAVAVAFNNTSFIRNRFFEQEFYDLQRVEVLRGPQGTLYGRNATAGVVNIISAKPKFDFEARASADVANYASTRIEGMVNIPVVEDAVALRLAGAWTKRDGFVTNEITGNPIDGRDLWSTRVSLRFAPNDAIDANFIWEHFEEDDDRLRSGKQLCKTDDRTEINGVPRNPNFGADYFQVYSQGCIPESLYAPESFQAPDGMSLPYYHPLSGLQFPAVPNLNPYLRTMQSRDLRVIESTVDPQYRAKSDLAELQINIDVDEHLTLTSETAYSADDLFSTQDYNRFNTTPGVFNQAAYNATGGGPVAKVLNNGVFCDPQIGCADRLVAMDLSTAESRQFSQELRISSDFDGPFNFSLGGNFLRYDTEDKYYVFVNSLSLYSAMSASLYSTPSFLYVPGVTDNTQCLSDVPPAPDPTQYEGVTGCIYIDPNPIDNLNDRGHNYFLSRNPYKLVSYALFGESYYNITPDLKLTGGLRFTVDRKSAPRIPSWLLAARTVGLTVAEIVEQEWREPTGRLAIDWKPDLAFTDDTLLYASFARGYKAGGANPPAAGVVSYIEGDEVSPKLVENSAAQPKTFAPEFVNAFEIGSKNTLFDGRMTLNFGAFYYDYTGYQISYIVNRSAVNLNFDAEIWGLELEADWRPTDNLRFGFKGGYENTRVADGSKAIDMMDRTAGNPDWIVIRPFPTFPSNCIVPMYTVTDNIGAELTLPGALYTGGLPGPCEFAYSLGLDPITRLPYVPNPTVWQSAGAIRPITADWLGYEGWDPTVDYGNNNGEGFYKDLSGNELPNAPHFTATITADYTVPLAGDWLVNLHADLYYQSEAWTRIFNTEGYDKLKAYTNVNLAAILTNEDAGWKVMAYVKNVMDRDSITGAFLNSDDSGLTTNVFLTEPRLYGIRVTKDWSGGGFLGLGGGSARPAGTPYPFQVEIGAGVSRFDGDVEPYAPDWIAPPLSELLAWLEEDLDWGDLRGVKLTYAARNGWKASLAYYYGRTNGAARDSALEETPDAIALGAPFSRDNVANLDVLDGEEHAIADFMVGKDLGLGAWGESGKSTLSAGLRYASFKSDSRTDIDGLTNSYLAPILGLKYGAMHWNTSFTTLDSTREFDGTGPAVSWESAVRLAGDDESGHVDLDWRVGGAVLFGKQTMDSTEERRSYYHYAANLNSALVTTTLYNEVVPRHRTKDVTVPNLSLSLGLSYTINRVKVSTGYSYDRFFDAIDGGWKEAKDYDRTIDGPYFKLSVGFGG